MVRAITEVFRIDYPNSKAGKKLWCKEYGFNRFYAGVHWSERQRAADYWHNITRVYMERAGVRKTPFEKPVVIAMYFNDRMDCSNHAAMFKMIEDGLKGRLIQDDSREWVKGNEIYFHDEDCIKVVVREIEEGVQHGKTGK